MKNFLEAGEFVTTHGILGELKLYPWCDGPEFLCGLKRLFMSADGKKQIEIEKIRPQKNMCLVKLAGINSPEQARVFIGKTAYLAREDVKLEKGSYFIQDLLGLIVKNAKTGQIYGEISDVTRPGAHNVYNVKSDTGKEFLFPAVPEFIEKTDMDDGVIYINPIAGMFEEGAKSDDED